MISLLGLALFQFGGAVLRRALTGLALTTGLRSPNSLWFALALTYAFSLGPIGIAALLPLGLYLVRSPRGEVVKNPRLPMVLLGIAAVMLTRPWVPTMWDEFVWLAKARVNVQAALDPSLRLIPPGYPALWPASVSWLSLGVDEVHAHVLAASLLVIAAVGSCLEAWWARLRVASPWGLVVLAAPLVWVHGRATYVDLPLGLLGAALCGLVLSRQFAVAVVISIVMCGFKDEGLVHVVAANAAAFIVTRDRRVLAPALAGTVTTLLWRALIEINGVANEHALSSPSWHSVPGLARLFVLHATDLTSWGALWTLTLAAALVRTMQSSARVLRWALAFNVVFAAAALISAPEQVRAFAENGTLLNRLLMQWWPLAALLVLETRFAALQKSFEVEPVLP